MEKKSEILENFKTAIGSTVKSGIIATSYEDGNIDKAVTFNVLGVLNNFVGEAINLMNRKKITSLFICDKKKPLGIVHIHDLLRLTS